MANHQKVHPQTETRAETNLQATHHQRHTITVKVVDNEGLESIETVKLKVNGVVKKM